MFEGYDQSKELTKALFYGDFRVVRGHGCHTIVAIFDSSSSCLSYYEMCFLFLCFHPILLL